VRGRAYTSLCCRRRRRRGPEMGRWIDGEEGGDLKTLVIFIIALCVYTHVCGWLARSLAARLPASVICRWTQSFLHKLSLIPYTLNWLTFSHCANDVGRGSARERRVERKKIRWINLMLADHRSIAIRHHHGKMYAQSFFPITRECVIFFARSVGRRSRGRSILGV
jgi:phosphoribosylformylglycinamidine (FGAM) synthase-like amidotransferase family enzyme